MECLINTIRVANHVRPLQDNPHLDFLAEIKILQDISCNQFSHYPCGVNLQSKAEVLGYGSGMEGYSGPILKAWLKSESHRQIILGARWHFFGVASWRGRFLGHVVTFWSVEFV